MSWIDREIYFNDCSPDEIHDLPFPDSDPHLQSPYEEAFEDFFDCILQLEYKLTQDMCQLRKFGMSEVQETCIYLARYPLQKLRQVYEKHPLYHAVYEEDI